MTDLLNLLRYLQEAPAFILAVLMAVVVGVGGFRGWYYFPGTVHDRDKAIAERDVIIVARDATIARDVDVIRRLTGQMDDLTQEVRRHSELAAANGRASADSLEIIKVLLAVPTVGVNGRTGNALVAALAKVLGSK